MPLTLSVYAELSDEKLSFIDRLNRLEELGLVNKNEWLTLRKERSEIAHEYSFNQLEVIESINIIYKKTDGLAKIYDAFYQSCSEKFNFVKESSVLKSKYNTCLLA